MISKGSSKAASSAVDFSYKLLQISNNTASQASLERTNIWVSGLTTIPKWSNPDAGKGDPESINGSV